MEEPKITKEQLKEAHDANYRVPDSDHLDKTAIKGHDFNKEMNLEEFVSSFATTGMQATHLGSAIEVIKKMREDKVTIFLAYNSNMVTSGLREVIAYLVKNKLVHVLVTTAGGVEEDIMKTFKPFLVGDFKTAGKSLRKIGVNRTGNIFVPNDRYIGFETLMQNLLERLSKEQNVEVNEKTLRYHLTNLRKAGVLEDARGVYRFTGFNGNNLSAALEESYKRRADLAFSNIKSAVDLLQKMHSE